MIEKLRQIMKEYDFISDDINIDYVLAETIVYIQNLEKNYNELAELNGILRHNLQVAERKNKKK